METKKLKLLIVDDCEENIRAARLYFEGRKSGITLEQVARPGFRTDKLQESELNGRDVEVTYAKSLEEGMEQLETMQYDAAIFDLDMPQKAGQEVVKGLGWKLCDEADRYKMSACGKKAFTQELDFLVPYAVISSGKDHHDCTSAKAYFPTMKEREIYEFGKYAPSKGYVPEFRLTEKPKACPEAWKTIYEAMEDMYNLDDNRLMSQRRRIKAENFILGGN